VKIFSNKQEELELFPKKTVIISHDEKGIQSLVDMLERLYSDSKPKKEESHGSIGT